MHPRGANETLARRNAGMGAERNLRWGISDELFPNAAAEEQIVYSAVSKTFVETALGWGYLSCGFSDRSASGLFSPRVPRPLRAWFCSPRFLKPFYAWVIFPPVVATALGLGYFFVWFYRPLCGWELFFAAFGNFLGLGCFSRCFCGRFRSGVFPTVFGTALGLGYVFPRLFRPLWAGVISLRFFKSLCASGP